MCERILDLKISKSSESSEVATCYTSLFESLVQLKYVTSHDPKCYLHFMVCMSHLKSKNLCTGTVEWSNYPGLVLD